MPTMMSPTMPNDNNSQLFRHHFLGTDPLQSLVWRSRWEQTREPVWKGKLVTYNAEDCAALKKVTEPAPSLAVNRSESNTALQMPLAVASG